MIVIGIDPHKSTHTATAVDPVTHTDLGSLRIDAAYPDYGRLLRWAAQWPQHYWAVENARGLGRHLTQWLLAHGETVVDVPATATARVRELSRGGGRKNDRLDAAAAASVAAAHGDANPVEVEDLATVLGLLDERRTNLSTNRTRTINELHAMLRDLLPGGAPTALTADRGGALIRGIRVETAPQKARLAICRDLIAEIRRLDTALAGNAKQMRVALDEHGTTLREVDGVGDVIAARLIGRTRSPSRFPTAAAYASYTGTAPVQVASADSDRHRLNRGGDRQLNSAIHIIAVTQIRMPDSDGHAYVERHLAAHVREGGVKPAGVKPATRIVAERSARRALKRHLAAHLWKIMLADEKRLHQQVSEGHPSAA